MISTINDFRKAYSLMLGKAWSSDQNMGQLKSNPVKTLNDAGFQIPDGASVQIHVVNKSAPYEEFTKQFNEYKNDFSKKKFDFYILDKPPANVKIEGGHPVDVQGGNTYCCCCCPCCTCT